MSRPPHAVSGSFAPPAPARELTVTSADGAGLHVEVHGPADAPAVVLAHGWTCSIAFWAPVVRALAADHRVVLYDQRGHGRSPASDLSAYGTRVLADDLAAVLDQTLLPGERAVLAAHSMGAMAIVAAAGRPQLQEHAAAALLCSTGITELVPEARLLPLGPKRLQAAFGRFFLRTRAPMGPVTPISRSLLKYGTMGRTASPAAADACARIVQSCPGRVRAAWGRVLETLDLESELAQLTVPTAVIVGTRDRLTPRRHSRALAAGLPRGLGLTELDGFGHMTPMEAPDTVTSAIRGLVGEHLTDRPPLTLVDSGKDTGGENRENEERTA
ncbi:alpha/beta hydrolase [Streptomyces sp. B1866]|uniref:alpha/beta fold hydrolase n=1 Tax=Streptomyces sp. B1866 TaxID=3075431 RepID=UPI00288F74E7|nr:alpha/beta hydrolase [Streptomyces sp. B1866]MDT3398094.1 alpha/beta hydrolase [Streptomyces sp. B1866]